MGNIYYLKQMSDNNLSNNMTNQEDYQQNNDENINENDKIIKSPDNEKLSNNIQFSPSPKRDISVARSNTPNQHPENENCSENEENKEHENICTNLDSPKDDPDVYTIAKSPVCSEKNDKQVKNKSPSIDNQNKNKIPSIDNEIKRS